MKPLTFRQYRLFALIVLTGLICVFTSCTKTDQVATFGTPSEVTVQQVKGYVLIQFNGPAKPYERILEVETVVGGVVARTRVQVKEGARNASGGYWANGVLRSWRVMSFSQVFY